MSSFISDIVTPSAELKKIASNSSIDCQLDS